MPSKFLIENYEQIVKNIADLTLENSRKSDSVNLLAVSKNFPICDIEELYNHGCRLFGESRIQELEEKYKALPKDIEWHFIGQLQSNKVRRVVKIASLIHSVDSLGLIERLDRIAGEEAVSPRFLLEVNVAGEESKSGFAFAEAYEAALTAAKVTNVKFEGFMTIAPALASESELGEIFHSLYDLKERVERHIGYELPHLSMGMSDDYHLAIMAGATLVRVGSAIFGARNYSIRSVK